MNEKQFLDMSDRERDQFIERKVYGKNRAYILPYHTTHWDSLGKGIEHANENGYFVTLHQIESTLWRVEICIGRDEFMEFARNKNIFLAFWIAYMKALGVLE